MRALSEFAPKPLPGSENATYFFWSPDSREVAFVREGAIWRVGVDSGEAIQVGKVLPDLQGNGGGVWTAGGDLVLAGSDRVGLFAVPSSGGEGREIVPLDRNQETDYHDVSELPEGRGFLITVHRLQGPDTIAAVADGNRQNVLQIAGGSPCDRRNIRPRGTSSTRAKRRIPVSGRFDSRCHASPLKANLSSSRPAPQHPAWRRTAWWLSSGRPISRPSSSPSIVGDR